MFEDISQYSCDKLQEIENENMCLQARAITSVNSCKQSYSGCERLKITFDLIMCVLDKGKILKARFSEYKIICKTLKYTGRYGKFYTARITTKLALSHIIGPITISKQV